MTLYSGRTGLEIDHLEGEASQDHFVLASFATDYTQDGIVEILVGAGGVDSHGNNAGRLSLFDGATRALLRTWDGTVSNEGFGVGSLAPDWDGDGILDIAGSSPSYLNFSPPWYQGVVYLFSGRDGSLLWRQPGAHDFAHFGSPLSLAGDVDADGVPDLLVGSRGENDRGAIYVYSGRTHEVLHHVLGSQKYTGLDNAIGVGDFDRDGHDDFAATEAGTKSVRVFSGATGDFLLRRSEGDIGFWKVSGVGDVNGDDWVDVLVGASNKEGGAAYLYSGFSRKQLYRFDNWGRDNDEEAFGFASSGLGDLNQDGLADFAITSTSYEESPGYYPGAVFVYAGNDLWLQSDHHECTAGDTVVLDTRGGEAQARTLVAVVELDGTPYFRPLAFGKLDDLAELSLSLPVPDSAVGHTIGVQSYSQRLQNPGRPRDSAVERIVVK